MIPFPRQCQKGLKDQRQVKTERGLSQVIFSESDLVWQNVPDILLFRVLCVPKHLRFISVFKGGYVRNSGQDIEDLFVVPPKHFYILRDFWSWTNKAHFTLQNIEKLRKFINFGLAQNPPHSGDARIC